MAANVADKSFNERSAMISLTIEQWIHTIISMFKQHNYHFANTHKSFNERSALIPLIIEYDYFNVSTTQLSFISCCY